MIRYAWVPVAVRLIGLLIAGMSVAGCFNAIMTAIAFPMVNNGGFVANSWRFWPMTGSFVALGFGAYLLFFGGWISSLILRRVESGAALPSVRLVGLLLLGLSVAGCVGVGVRSLRVRWMNPGYSFWQKTLELWVSGGALLGAALGMWLLLDGRVVARLVDRGWMSRCPRCRYDVSGSAGITCPECGFELRDAPGNEQRSAMPRMGLMAGTGSPGEPS